MAVPFAVGRTPIQRTARRFRRPGHDWVLMQFMNLKKLTRQQLLNLLQDIEQELENRQFEERLRWEIRRRGQQPSA